MYFFPILLKYIICYIIRLILTLDSSGNKLDTIYIHKKNPKYKCLDRFIKHKSSENSKILKRDNMKITLFIV